MNGLQRRTAPTLELSGVAITTPMAFTVQQVTATTALRLAATAAIRLGPYFM